MADYDLAIPSVAPRSLDYGYVDGGDSVAPAISLVSPTGFAPVIQSDTPIVLTISDDDPGIAFVTITVKYKNVIDPVVLYDNGFSSSFTNSTILGDTYTLRANRGWVGTIENLKIRAIDGDGNLISVGYTLTMPAVVDITGLMPLTPGASLERVDRVRQTVSRIYSQFMVGYSESELL